MKLTIVYDNTTQSPDLIPDWGFACVIETGESCLLFDSGSDGYILLNNMRVLGIDPQNVDTVFLSHNHFDHIGGLAAFLRENGDVKVIAPPSLRGIRRSRELVYAESPLDIAPGLASTGEVDGMEQALVVNTDSGAVLVTGCSHPEMPHLLARAGRFGPVKAVIGGLHGFDEYSLFNDLNLLCATHCTRNQDELNTRFSRIWVPGGAGAVISF